MRRHQYWTEVIVSVVIILLLTTSCRDRAAAESASAAEAAAAPTTSTIAIDSDLGDNGDAELLAIIVAARDRHKVPAIGAAIVTPHETKVAVTGIRKFGDPTPVALSDKWHLGSNTKAMTATIIGKLVEQQKLDWATTLAEIFPELTEMHPAFTTVTVEQILCHRGGMPANVDYEALDQTSTLTAQRYSIVRDVTTQRPKYKPGSRDEYSNVGYIISGAIIEKITGEPWENVIRREIFEPLGMTSAGFGGTGTPGQIDQPWPHHFKYLPATENGPETDNPPVVAPAGTVHCSLEDYAIFIRQHLNEGDQPDALLSAETFKRLHKPIGEMSPGWVVLDRSWGGGTVYTHAGSNTMNYVVVWMAPAKDVAFIVAINEGSAAASVVDEVATKMILHYLGK